MGSIPTILDIIHERPGFYPAHGIRDNVPSDEEIYAANSVTFFDMVRLGMLTDTVEDGVIKRSKEEKFSAMCEKYGWTGGLTPQDELRMVEVNHERLAARMAQAGIPTSYYSAPANMQWNEYFDSGGIGAYFHGTPGVGKTHTAVSIMKGWMEAHPYDDAVFVSAPKLVSEMASTFNTGTTKEDVMRRYSEVPFLVLDDLGKEERTDVSVSRIWRLIDERSSMRRPTIITSQYSPSGLLAGLSDEDSTSLGSRIKGFYEIRSFGGADKRLEGRQATA